MKKSVWSENTDLPEFPSLNGDKKTDVLIIGGGLCGILCALFLKEKGVDYILVEGGKIASGTTKNTTAKITALHGLIYDKLISDFGTEKAHMYLQANLSAVENYRAICEKISCDFETKPAYTYSLNNREKIEKEVYAVNKLGFSANFVHKTELPFKVSGAVCFENQAQFNPLKFIKETAKDLNIYEKTFIRNIDLNGAVFDKGRIAAKKIIVTTHFPFINTHGSYFLKLYQHRSYVSAYSDVGTLSGMYVSEAENGMSFRSYKDILLIGGADHRTGKQSGNWQTLSLFQKEYFPGAKLKYSWAAQDCMSLDSVPYIGRYSKRTPDLFVATGFNKWGMSSSMVAAKILSDMVTDSENEYAPVFSPSRSILKPQLLVNGFESALNLLTPSLRRCPHLGCALKWNKYEHSWDCPCHGSRFEEDGKLIDNPATKNANISKNKD